MGPGSRPSDHRADGRHRPDRPVTICGTDLHILKGDVPEMTAGHDSRPRGRRHGRRGRRGGDDARSRRSRPRLLHHRVRALPLLQGGPLWPLHRRRRLDLRPPDRRRPGRVRARSVRRHVRLQGARRTVSDEQVLFLADILPTAYEVGVLNGRVEPGDTVAIVGAGPIGLAAIMTAQLHSPGPDHRHRPGRRPTRDGTRVRRRHHDQQRPKRTPSRRSMDLTGGLGADVAIEAVGVPGDVRALRRADPARRPGRQRGRARQASDTSPRAAVDP